MNRCVLRRNSPLVMRLSLRPPHGNQAGLLPCSHGSLLPEAPLELLLATTFEVQKEVKVVASHGERLAKAEAKVVEKALTNDLLVASSQHLHQVPHGTETTEMTGIREVGARVVDGVEGGNKMMCAPGDRQLKHHHIATRAFIYCTYMRDLYWAASNY